MKRRKKNPGRPEPLNLGSEGPLNLGPAGPLNLDLKPLKLDLKPLNLDLSPIELNLAPIELNLEASAVEIKRKTSETLGQNLLRRRPDDEQAPTPRRSRRTARRPAAPTLS